MHNMEYRNHPWHDVSTGESAPEIVNCITEIPKGPKGKYELERDAKIIAVAKNDMSVNYIDELSKLPPHTLNKLKRFFEDYKKLEHKNVTVERFLGKQDAFRIIEDSMDSYRKNFTKRS
jgi:inorganic pyrophosphatase